MEADPPLLRVRGLAQRYTRRRGVMVEALRGVDLSLAPGDTLALVGQSGSGKSTFARCAARLEEGAAGEVWFEGVDVTALRGRALRPFRARVQLVLQDSAQSLDPRMTAAEIVGEPLEIAGRGDRAARRRRALELMESVALAPEAAARRPLELSGGQRQRLAVARALAVEPTLLILDEAFAGLDASVQAQIAGLLAELRARLRLTYLYISHDLPLMAAVATRAAILHEGRIVEEGSTARLFAAPQHPHTRALVEASQTLPARAV
jgi:peptide/nickel transport system ATP-binding protein